MWCDVMYNSHTYHSIAVKIIERELCFFYFLSHFYFLFDFFFTFSIFRTLGLGLEVIDHISHLWWCGHNIDHETWEKKVEGSGTKWCHTTWTLYVGLILYTWSFRVGCTVASMDQSVGVYKIDYFVKNSLSSSLVLL